MAQDTLQTVQQDNKYYRRKQTTLKLIYVFRNKERTNTNTDSREHKKIRCVHIFNTPASYDKKDKS
jgi:hypothetical protein